MNHRERCTGCETASPLRKTLCPACAAVLIAGLLGGAQLTSGCLAPDQPRPEDPAGLMGEGRCNNALEDDPLCAGGLYGAPFASSAPARPASTSSNSNSTSTKSARFSPSSDDF